MEELIMLMQDIKDILLTINSNIEELNEKVESLANGGAYSISDICDKLDSIASTMSSIETTVSSIDMSVNWIEANMP